MTPLIGKFSTFTFINNDIKMLFQARVVYTIYENIVYHVSCIVYYNTYAMDF